MLKKQNEKLKEDINRFENEIKNPNKQIETIENLNNDLNK